VKSQIESSKTIHSSVTPTKQIPNPRSYDYSPPPLTLLPSVIREYVRAEAEALDVDVAFILLPLLSALAAAIGNSRTIRIKKGFVQPAILWTAIVARSGSKKSPALSTIGKFFKTRERELMGLNTEALKLFDRHHREWASMSKTDRWEEPKPPARLTCLLDDLTLAAAAPILADNPRGVLVAKDELASWLGSFGQFSNTSGGASADLSGWLSLYNGEMLLVDRKTNRESYRIFDPRLSVAGCIPPSVLRGALTNDFFGRGLPARILFAAPPPRTNIWKDLEAPVELEDALNDTFNRLFNLRSEVTNDGPKPTELSISPDGLEVFKNFYNRVGQYSIGVEEKEEAAWSKLIGVAARLALVGHLTNGFDQVPVGSQVMEAAVELASWFGQEAERLYATFSESEEQKKMRRLLEFIERRDGSVTVREIADNFRPLKNEVKKIEEQLSDFVKGGIGEWIPVDQGTRGGRPTRKFRLLTTIEERLCPGNHAIRPKSIGFTDTDTFAESEPAVVPHLSAVSDSVSIGNNPAHFEQIDEDEQVDLVFP
jgi:hypothetical protein